ncbi:MAG: asparagine synthase (glutamine-hydrolyzing) [Bryobacteraceae bacterium]|nr:asparagine synthase (glutamine-hydrolyzing) [Bryobacteraceae bacterium]
MTARLTHRGPDGSGLYLDGPIALGHRRLAIIDLAGGAQPMPNEDGSVWITYNGELYNEPALREELEAKGHRYRTQSDTETLVHLYEEEGEDFAARLNGMFALAIWQESEKKLFLARDRMGIKPLYYLRRGSDLHFGSELKAILAHPEVERRISRSGLSYYLGLNWVPGPYTLVEGIVKLPPGHWLEWQNGRIQSGSYWKLDFRVRPDWSFGEAKEELDSLLASAVREHLISDVPLGVWSSGGLDSSTILHYAAQSYPGRLKTFSVSFRGRSFDESPYFRLVSSVYGTDHHEFDLNPDQDLPAAIEELSYYCDEPSADAGALPVWFLSKMCRRLVTVALSGEGADELFGGYITYLADRSAALARLAPEKALRAALWMARRWPVSDDKVSLEYKVKRFLEGALLDPDEAHVFWNGTFRTEDKRRLCRFDEHPPVRRLFESLPPDAAKAGKLNRYLWFDQLYYLPDDILTKCDRMSMAHSLEVRPAFLDHRIVEFAASLPESFKIRGWTLKFLLRELMRGRLPAEVLKRSKQGFDIPAHDWLRGPLRTLLLDTLTDEAVAASGLFRPEAVRALIRAHLERKANYGYHLWGLLTLFLWLRRWRIATVPREDLRPTAVEESAPAT